MNLPPFCCSVSSWAFWAGRAAAVFLADGVSIRNQPHRCRSAPLGIYSLEDVQDHESEDRGKVDRAANCNRRGGGQHISPAGRRARMRIVWLPPWASTTTSTVRKEA